MMQMRIQKYEYGDPFGWADLFLFFSPFESSREREREKGRDMIYYYCYYTSSTDCING